MTFSNSSFDLNSPRKEHNTVIAVLGTILIIWIVSFNILLIASILSNRKSRGRLFNWLVINTASIFVCLGIFVIPVAVYTHVTDDWVLPRNFCIAWIFLDIGLNTAAVISILSLAFERFLSGLIPEFVATNAKIIRALLVLFPWIVSIVLVVSIAAAEDLDQVFDSTESICVSQFTSASLYATSIVGFFLPFLPTLLFSVAGVIFHSGRRIGRGDNQLRIRRISGVSAAMACLLAAVIMLALMFPFNLYLIWYATCDRTSMCPPISLPVTLFVALYYMAPGIAQLAWLLDQNIREALLGVLTCKVCRGERQKDAHDKNGNAFAKEYPAEMTSSENNLESQVTRMIDEDSVQIK